MVQRFYEDEGMNFAVLLSLGAAYANLADVGETLAVVERVPDGDSEAWIAEWSTLAGNLAAQAERALDAGHRVTARSKFLRAATYFDHASAMAPGSRDPARYTGYWEHHRQCWDRGAALFDPPVEPVTIPYQDTELAGYLFHPRAGGPRPTLILNNGSDGPVSSQWSQGGRAAVARGWNALAFDGPGQGAGLHRQHLFFRHDWEHVITPVIDYLLSRPDVAGDRIALQGVSQGGYWAPRAAAFDTRIAALVADPGVVRVAASWEAHLPPEMVDLLDQGAKDDFDALMGADPEPRRQAMLAWRMAPYGLESPFATYVATRRMTLDPATAARIRCPTLVLDPDHEQFWPGQSAELFDALTCRKELARFTAAEGADWHCEPAAQSLRDERVFDFLEEVIG